MDDIEKALIDLYETGMLHGEAQANGVLPTQSQRENSIILAKALIASDTEKEVERATLHLSDVSRAIGLLEALGHSDAYLEEQKTGLIKTHGRLKGGAISQ